MSGAERIAAERRRQVEQEGYTPSRDDGYTNWELSEAAVAYLTKDPPGSTADFEDPPAVWPWGKEHWKPGERLRNLEKAGALVAAEIDRELRRLARTAGGLDTHLPPGGLSGKT